MNYKLLGKAMSFMFLPTLGVLIILLVGFFDPIAMWLFIKSNDGWAVFTRVVLLIAEIALITSLYFHYLEDYKKQNIAQEEKKVIIKDNINKYESITAFVNGSFDSDSRWLSYKGWNNNITILEKIN